MKPATCRVVVFDLAGTTMNDSEHVASAFVAALGEEGIAVAATEVAGMRGASKRQALARIIPGGPLPSVVGLLH